MVLTEKSEQTIKKLALVLNTLDLIASKRIEDTPSVVVKMATDSANMLRSIVPMQVLESPCITQLDLQKDASSICEFLAVEFKVENHYRYHLVNHHSFTIVELCESIASTEKSEATEWFGGTVGDVPRITYSFADSSSLHVYPTLGYWTPS